jgi:hypothetical protein
LTGESDPNEAALTWPSVHVPRLKIVVSVRSALPNQQPRSTRARASNAGSDVNLASKLQDDAVRNKQAGRERIPLAATSLQRRSGLAGRNGARRETGGERKSAAIPQRAWDCALRLSAPDRIRTCDLRFRRPTHSPGAKASGWGSRHPVGGNGGRMNLRQRRRSLTLVDESAHAGERSPG